MPRRYTHRITHHPEDRGCGCRSDMEGSPNGEYVRYGELEPLLESIVKLMEHRDDEHFATPDPNGPGWIVCPKCFADVRRHLDSFLANPVPRHG